MTARYIGNKSFEVCCTGCDEKVIIETDKDISGRFAVDEICGKMSGFGVESIQYIQESDGNFLKAECELEFYDVPGESIGNVFVYFNYSGNGTYHITGIEIS